MLIEHSDTTGAIRRYVLRPNRSMSPRGMAWFVTGIGALAILIALRFVALNAWMVLPFAIAEVAALGIAFFVVARAGRRCEIIDLDEREVRVIRDDGREREEWRFQPYWLQVVLQLDPGDWYPSRLFLRSHGRQLEIGSSLTDEERRKLSDELKRRLTRNPAADEC